MEEIKRLLDSVNSILKEEKIKKEESLRRGERFNMFEICGVAHYEVMHSTIIASFLNPNSSHGQKDLFLKLFFSVVGDKTNIDTTSASVFTEYPIEDGRIDILVEDNKGKGVIIENKVYASDQNEQLIRYNRFAKNKYRNGYSIYYLTLDGCEASENSAKNVDYIRISYKEHIISWIDSCIKESSTTPLIRETLVQYRNHLKQLTNQDMETKNKEELIKAMVNNSQAIAALFNVQEDYKRYAFDNYVKPTLVKFASEYNLIYKECNLFAYGEEKGFCFHRESWKNYGIWIYSWKKNSNSGFVWAISNYGEVCKFDSSSYFIGGKADDIWPCGYAYLEKYGNWDDMNTISSMINGDFAKYIIHLVSLALKNIDEKHLQIP